MNRAALIEIGGGRYCFVNAVIHHGHGALSSEDREAWPLTHFATHGNINFIGQQMLPNKWSSNARYSPSSAWLKFMATGNDRTFNDDDIKQHLLGLLTDADKRWGVCFVNDEPLPVSVNDGDARNEEIVLNGYGGVRAGSQAAIQRIENVYY